MSILFVGAEEIDFPLRTASPTTSAGYFRSAYSRLGFSAGVGFTLGTQEWTDAPEFWFTCRFMNINAGTTSAAIFVFYRGGTEVFRIRCGATTWGLFEIYQNSTVRAAAAANTMSANTIYKWDVHYLKSANGYVRVYKDGTSSPLVEYSGDTSAWGDVDQVVMFGHSTATAFMEVIVTDTEDTRTWSLRTLAPSGAGASNAWSGGTYADVDDTTLDVGDVMYSSTAAQEASLALADAPAGTFGVRQVRVHAYAARGTSGPSKLALGVRASSANYYGADQSLDLGWKEVISTWDTNPATGNGWSSAEVTAMELALKSVT